MPLFKKGHVPWNTGKEFMPGEKHPLYGTHRSEETKKKISTTRKERFLEGKIKSHRKGKTLSEETITKIKEARKRQVGDKTPMYGKHHTETSKLKMRQNRRGKCLADTNHRWAGGSSFGKYCPKFNREFKERVREYFRRKCVVCGKTEDENGKKLEVHHVNYDKTTCCNNIEPSFVLLCMYCHRKTYLDREKWKSHYETLIMEKYGGKCYYTKEEFKSVHTIS